MSEGAPYVHGGDPAYAPPVLRAPSPTSSIGTEYPPDETTQAEELMTDDDLAKRLKLNHPWITEAWSWRDPLLPKPVDAKQETQLHMSVMHHLRGAVKRVRDDELFEQRILRGSLVPEQDQAPSGDIDSIMRSMMKLSPNQPSASTDHPTTSEPRDIVQPPYTPIMANGVLPSTADLSFDQSFIPPIEPMGPPPLPAFLDIGPNTDMNPMTSTPGRRSTRLRTNTRRP